MPIKTPACKRCLAALAFQKFKIYIFNPHCIAPYGAFPHVPGPRVLIIFGFIQQRGPFSGASKSLCMQLYADRRPYIRA